MTGFKSGGRTERHLLAPRADGAPACQLDIFLPEGPSPPEGWRSLFLLDAEGCFATAAEALGRMSRRPDATGVSPLLIVGISAASDRPDFAARRWNFTPPPPDAAHRDGSGGAEAFLDLLQTGVKPLVASRAPLDPNRQTLFGHSLAGYFTLWSMFHDPAGFRAYAAISPSIWWDRSGLSRAAEGADLSGRHALILTGQWEGELPPWQAIGPDSADIRARRAARDMIGNAEALAELLARRMDQGSLDHAVLPGEDHASIISAAIPRALRLACRA